MLPESVPVTLFAPDKDQPLSEPTTLFDALVQIRDGKAELVIEGKPVFSLAALEHHSKNPNLRSGEKDAGGITTR